jgi:glycosyltransferase involved in cell wall biosynthesis
MTLDPVNGGGTVERTSQMSRFLVYAGIKCTIVTTDSGLASEYMKRLEGLEVKALTTLCKRFFLPKCSFKGIRNIVKDVDIVHLMNHWTLLNVMFYLASRRCKVPYVVCPAGSLAIYGRSKAIKRLFDWIIGNRIIQNASGWISVSRNEIDHFSRYGIDKGAVTLIPNGVNPDDFAAHDDRAFREKIGIGDAPFLLFLGRLNSIKGPDLLVKVFCDTILRKFPQHHLVLAGPDAGMLSCLTEIVAESGAEHRVHFIGHIDGVEKCSCYHAADLLVIPSRQEAMSIVVLESGIVGTPVLLTDQCGFNEVQEIGGGKVVPATIDGLREGLLELLSRPDIMKAMGEKLHKYVCDNFTWDKIVGRYINLYETIVG